MFKKILSLCLAVLMAAACLGMVACTDMNSGEAKMTDSPLPEVELTKDFDVPADFKIGFILLHDEASTYDLNFINAVKKVQAALGLTDEQINRYSKEFWDIQHFIPTPDGLMPIIIKGLKILNSLKK